MNARPSIPELDRIRRDIGARLRIEHAVTEPAPENLIALLKELATRVRDAKREKLFAEVDAQVAELLRAAGRQPQDAYRPAGESADETVHTVRSPEATLAKSAECGTLGVAQEDVVHFQIVMDTSGDTRHHFHPDDASALAEAEKRFRNLVEAGFIAAKRTGDGTSELVRQFDPAAQETVFIPRLVGG